MQKNFTGFFFIILIVLFCTCESRRKTMEISVEDFKFDGPLGSAGTTIEKVATNHFKVTLGHAPNHPDWNNKLQFEITRHAKGNSLKLHVVFLGGDAYRFNEYFHSWSYDGENWHPVQWQLHSKDSAAGDTLIFPTFTEDRVFVGHQVPLSYEDLRRFVKKWESNPNVTVHILGQSLGGRDLFRLEITDPASSLPRNQRVVHHFSNQHPGEHNSQWRMVGMINWLLSEAGAEYRRQSICHFIPMMSPDAPTHGWYRVNAQGIDMNRSYRVEGADSAQQAHEAWLVQSDLEKIMAKTPVKTLWSLHTWGGLVDPLILPGPEFGDEHAWKRFRDVIEKNDTPGLIDSLHLDQNPDNVTHWTDGPHRQFGITAILCEGSGGIFTKAENLKSGKILMQSIAEFYQPDSLE